MNPLFDFASRYKIETQKHVITAVIGQRDCARNAEPFVDIKPRNHAPDCLDVITTENRTEKNHHEQNDITLFISNTESMFKILSNRCLSVKLIIFVDLLRYN